MTKVMVESAPEMLRMGIFDTLTLNPINDFKVGNHLGPGSFGQRDQIFYVIKVTVRNQDIIRCDGVGRYLGAWIAGKKRIDDDLLTRYFQEVGRMANVRKLNRPGLCSLLLAFTKLRLSVASIANKSGPCQ